MTPTQSRRRASHLPLRVGESVARVLRERILSGEYSDTLPKQEALMADFQVSAPSIQARSAEGSSASTQARPRGENARPAMCSRRRGHSSAAALVSPSGKGMDGNSSGEVTCSIVISQGTAAHVPA